MSTARRQPTATLFAQLLALIVLSLVGALTINLLVVLNLPPPTPDFYRMAEIAQALKGQTPAINGARRPLVTHLADRPPAGAQPPAGFVSPGRTSLAALMETNPANVVISNDFTPFSDRRQFLIVRSELAKKGEPSEERFLIAPFQVGWLRPDGRWVIAEPKPTLEPSAWQQRLILSIILSALVLAPVAYLFARRLAKPIALFAQAAERLGRDPRAPPLAIRGPTEIGVAVQAFNDMQERLARYVEDRTAMVGAIAHDLRTPLTRLRFRVEAAPDELRAKMAADIAEMEAMISGTLAFVRDATRATQRTKLELSSLLESLADEMSETGLDVAVETADKVVIDGDPVALRRLFNNLLENALKFGRQARIRVHVVDDCAVVEIDDNGCGLPERDLERVFEPFYRHESSRSRETGGIGLGLAVARSVARAHGGDATLRNRPQGGLTATVKLPL
ncbi:MAG TPA: HAMP domain-containing sensor histidine kinase [Caulobacteraceae bacterium]|nr:HAMP domain-containing sensor histidine kinase [Caulobacteraceae bacterium]